MLKSNENIDINLSNDSQNNYEKEDINLFNLLNVNSPQNNRILIIGPSGSGKTQLLYDLILNYLPKHRRHIYLYGQEDILKKALIPEFKKNNVAIYEKLIRTNKDTLPNLSNLQRGDLLIIDDLTDLMSSSTTNLNKFLIKVFTTSRHQGYNVILIVHKFKLSNPLVRNNATKIILAGLDDELQEIFRDKIINKDIKPLCFNVTKDYQQEMLVSNNKKPLKGTGLKITDLMKSIAIRNEFEIPHFERRFKPLNFLQVNTNDETYQYKVPESLEKLFNKMIKKNDKLVLTKALDPFDEQNNEESNELIKAASVNREIVNTGELASGNDNVNLNKTKPFKTIKKRAK